MDTTTNDEAWKVFNRDTEAGRLLSRLYGVAPQGRVSYPKQRRRRRVTQNTVNDSNDKSASRWKTVGSTHCLSKEAEEEKEQERKNNIARALSLAVPKVGRGFGEQRHSNPDGNRNAGTMKNIPRRKTALTCRNIIEDTAQKNKHYRPPCSKDNSYEKNRLNDIFASKGGKCLPEDLTSIPIGDFKSAVPNPSSATRPSTLFDQIYHEILERRKHQLCLEELGSGEATREATAYEIKERLEQLKRLDSGRALTVVQKLMKS